MTTSGTSDDEVRTVGQPAFGEKIPTPDPETFEIKHPSDGPFYKEIDELNKEHKIKPTPFPAPRGVPEPILTLQDVLGKNAAAAKGIKWIQGNNQIVFHALGDCGNTTGPATQNEVIDKMVGDFNEVTNSEIPQFHLLLGDVVYSFGEVQYYYDQFYAPYRDYPAPILAAAGNHDGDGPARPSTPRRSRAICETSARKISR